jgi:uncharacterized glyoxalase superfamily protein PhnB
LDVRDQFAIEDRVQGEARGLGGEFELVGEKGGPHLHVRARSYEHTTPRKLAAHRAMEVPTGQSSHLRVAIERGEGEAATSSVLVRVENADSHHERAASHGARILRPPTDYPYGERQYTAEDLGGHRWTFSQSIADVDPASWGGTLIDIE